MAETRVKVGVDRWNFILPTKRGLATARRELLRDAVTVVCEGAIGWCAKNRADVWATQKRTAGVQKFPPNLVVWGPALDAEVWKVAGIQFAALPGTLDGRGLVMGPRGIPREADAFFLALQLACETCKAKRVRVFGALDWNRPDVRWKRWALANCIKLGGARGVEIERVR